MSLQAAPEGSVPRQLIDNVAGYENNPRKAIGAILKQEYAFIANAELATMFMADYFTKVLQV